MLKFMTIPALLLTVVASGGMAAAATVIDDFTTAGRVSDPASALVVTAEQFSAPSALLFGGFRDLEAERLTGASRTELETFNGNLLFSNGSGTSGIGRVTWDGDDDPTTVDTMGLGGLDLTSYGFDPAFFLDILFADADLGLLLTVWDLNGNSSTSSTTVSATFDPLTVFLPIPLFAGTADFSNVGALQLELSSGANLDAEIARIGISDAAVIPLPAAGWLLLSGVFGLGLVRARRPASGPRGA